MPDNYEIFNQKWAWVNRTEPIQEKPTFITYPPKVKIIKKIQVITPVKELKVSNSQQSISKEHALLMRRLSIEKQERELKKIIKV